MSNQRKANCGYRSLSDYNCGCHYYSGRPLHATATAGTYIVPDYDAPGYDALTHGKGGCCGCSGCGCGGCGGNGSCGGGCGGSYFGIDRAYHGNAGHCGTKFVAKLCGSCSNVQAQAHGHPHTHVQSTTHQHGHGHENGGHH